MHLANMWSSHWQNRGSVVVDGWQIFGEDAREANFSDVTTNLLKELETRETGAVQTSRLRCHLRIGRLESLLHRLRVHLIKILDSLVLILKSKGVPGGKSSILPASDDNRVGSCRKTINYHSRAAILGRAINTTRKIKTLG